MFLLSGGLLMPKFCFSLNDAEMQFIIMSLMRDSLNSCQHSWKVCHMILNEPISFLMLLFSTNETERSLLFCRQFPGNLFICLLGSFLPEIFEPSQKICKESFIIFLNINTIFF